MFKSEVPTHPLASLTRTVTTVVPATTLAFFTVPSDAKETPAGSVPPVIENCSGATAKRVIERSDTALN